MTEKILPAYNLRSKEQTVFSQSTETFNRVAAALDLPE